MSILWTDEDNAEAIKLGWAFNIIHGFDVGGPLIATPMTPISYELMWEDPALAEFRWIGIDPTDPRPLVVSGWEPELPPIDLYVAERAAQGIPLYERAWLAWCQLNLQGDIIRYKSFGLPGWSRRHSAKPRNRR